MKTLASVLAHTPALAWFAGYGSRDAVFDHYRDIGSDTWIWDLSKVPVEVVRNELLSIIETSVSK